MQVVGHHTIQSGDFNELLIIMWLLGGPCLCTRLQGPVVWKPISANPGLNFNLGFFFSSSKALPLIIFYIVFRVSNHQIVGKENEIEFVFSSLI